MLRIILATIAVLALALGGAANAGTTRLAADASTCGKVTIVATGLQTGVTYQLVSINGNTTATREVIASNGSATATFARSEFSPDSSANWGQAQVRTQYGGWLAFNEYLVNGVLVPGFAAYRFC